LCSLCTERSDLLGLSLLVQFSVYNSVIRIQNRMCVIKYALFAPPPPARRNDKRCRFQGAFSFESN
jgi:hypothetical protein